MNDHLVDHGFLSSKDRAADREQSSYEHFFAEIDERHRSEYESDYSAAYRAKHPYKTNSQRVHYETLARMAEIDAE